MSFRNTCSEFSSRTPLVGLFCSRLKSLHSYGVFLSSHFSILISLDRAVLLFINSFARRSWSLDVFVHFLASNHLLKGCVFMSAFYFAWFQCNAHTTAAELNEKRRILLSALLICIPGLIVTRLMAATLPFRRRPLYDSALHLHRAFTFDSNTLETWSSFPSDHAVLFFALSMGVLLVSRKLGLFLFAYSIFFVCLPRVFLGIHYPSDILAGALLGCTLGYTASWPALRGFITRPALRLQEASPGLFYVFFFLC